MAQFPASIRAGATMRALVAAGLLLLALSACAAQPATTNTAAAASTVPVDSTVAAAPRAVSSSGAVDPTAVSPVSTAMAAVSETPAGAPEIVVYAADLPDSALSELEVWDAPNSPGGKLIGLTNTGDELDPPPENDPHATFEVQVQSGVPYRCWIHMLVGAPLGKSQANVVWVQFSDAVDKENQESLRPGTGSYLTAQGPAQAGWAWVPCDMEDQTDALVYFGVSGGTTVRLQAGMEGVGFDQVVLSAARFLENSPTAAVVGK